MIKKIAVINDLSGFGKCSLTAAISVLSAMGVQACPLPTAILTAQTGYPSYYCDDYTDKMEYYRLEWQKMGQKFDGIYTGFVAGEEQIGHIFRFVDTFDTPDTFLLVDPVMGDNGRKFKMFTPALLDRMRALARRADVITPNLTEACLLAGEEYEKISRISEPERLFSAIEDLAERLCESGPAHVVVTGIHFTDEAGVRQMGNLYVTKGSRTRCCFPYIGGSYSGTGDLFASCLAGGIARGDELPEVIRLAGEFLERSLTDTVLEQIPANDGVNYETHLSMLTPQKNEKEGRKTDGVYSVHL